MALNIGDNFKYQGKKPNFERDSFATKAEMKGFPEANVDEGHISFCEEDGKHYEFKAGNSVDTNTGKWREFTTNVDLSGYATKTEVQQSVANKVDKSYVDGKVDVKQDKLADGINIKTINGQPIMGKGNITIAGPDGQLDLSGYATKTEMLNNITDYNVSKHHPTEGIGGTNKFTLETAIKLIPESLRSVGIKCSFLVDLKGTMVSYIYKGETFSDIKSWELIDNNVNNPFVKHPQISPYIKELYIYPNPDGSGVDLNKVTLKFTQFFNNHDEHNYKGLSLEDDSKKYELYEDRLDDGYVKIRGKDLILEAIINFKDVYISFGLLNTDIDTTIQPSAFDINFSPTIKQIHENSITSESLTELNTKLDSKVKNLETNKIDGVYKYGRNLFNKNNIINSAYITYDSGIIATHEPSCSVSHLIPITEGKTYHLERPNLPGSVPTSDGIRFVKADKVTPLKPLNEYGVEYEVYDGGPIVKAPAGAAYFQFTVEFNGNKFDYDRIQFEEGEAFTSYEPYTERFQVDYKNLPKELEDLPKRVENIEISQQVINEVIDIASSDKIGFFSNSFLNGYCMLGKHAINNLSMFSDYIMYNFGHSGDDLLELLARVDKNEKWIGDVHVQDWGITYGVIAMQDNDGALYAASHDTYYENAKKLSNAIKAMGGIPILSTEHDCNNFYYALRRLAQDYKIMFMDWGRIAENLYNTVFRPFWYNSHPATRTAWMWTYGMKQYLDTLPRPRKSIKLFRKRPDIDGSNLQNLMYEDLVSRAEIFEELTCGVSALTEETDKFFDRISLTNTKYKDYKDEYQTLQTKQPVSFGDIALVEVITPYDRNGCTSLLANIECTGVNKAYVKKINSLQKPLPKQRFVAFGITSGSLSKGQTFQITGGVFNDNVKGSYIVEDVVGDIVVTTTSSVGKTTSGTDNPTTDVIGVTLKGSYDYPSADYMKRFNRPLGEWTEIPFSTKIDLSEYLKTCMDFDKVSLLLTGTGISITDISFTCSGKTAKQNCGASIIRRQNGTLLLAKTTFKDNDTEWDGLTGLTKYTPVKSTLDSQVESLPKGIEIVRYLNAGQSVKQALLVSKIVDNAHNVKLQVRVKVRYFPTYIDNDEKWNTSTIKRGSYDCANLVVKIAKSAEDTLGDVIAKIPVGLWWNEFIINTEYFGGTHIIIEAEHDKIQVAQCEVVQYE